MAATYSLTRPTVSIKDSSSTIQCTSTPTTPTGNNNTSTLTMYPFGGMDQDLIIVQGLETSDCYGSEEQISRPINLPQGYISISSVARRYSADGEDLLASPKYESDFWPPSLSVFTKRKRKVSYAEEAIKVFDDELDSSNKDDDGTSSQSSETSSPASSPFGSPLRISELFPSLSNLSLPKLPERSWFCNSCRKPKDECHCLCVIS